MATVTKPTWDRHETQRRIRHPLQALRGTIRRYVVLEGLAVALLFLAVCFWVWLLMDYGTFNLFGVDGIKWLDRNYPAGTAFFLRAFMLGLIALGLLVLVTFKVLRRLFTEFKDSSLALVLERRFPEKLGDRLITAVELADPKLTDKYGFSQDMIDYTIRSAAQRVEEVPVSEVFNWQRLRRQWLLVLGCTVGIYVLLFGLSAVILAANNESPGDFFARFNRTASIWAKRDVLLAKRVYWPTQAYVEFVRFQVSQTKPDGTEVMKVAREEKRPDLEVRAFQWVIYDPDSVDSIRPLKLADLKDWVGAADLDVVLPENYPHWVMNIEDLDNSVPATLIPDGWKEKTAGHIRKQLENPFLHTALTKAGVLVKVEAWLNWKNWTVDQLQVQMDKKEVRPKLRADHPDAVKKLEQLIGPGGTLEALATSPSTNWDIRQLKLPAQVFVHYAGKQTRGNPSSPRQDENRYYLSLNELKESVSLYVQAEDFHAAPKEIVLVPPPQFSRLEVEVDEPAYKYYRLQGSQEPLKGARFKSIKPLSLTGPTSQHEVLSGTSVKVIATVERPLKKGVSLVPPQQRKSKDGEVPAAVITQADDGKSFWLDIPNVTKTFEFELRFVDLDNVKGSRHIIIRAVPDQPPEEVVKLALGVQLRLPMAASASGEDGEGTTAAQAGGLKGYLITPDALVPFRGSMKDDIGLTRMDWIYDFEQVQFSLFRQNDPTQDQKAELKKKLEAARRIQLLATAFHGLPLIPPQGVAAPLGWLGPAELIERDIQSTAKEDSKRDIIKGSPVPLANFQAKLDQIDSNLALQAGTFLELVKSSKLFAVPDQPLPKQILPREYSLEAEEGFDVQKVLSAKFRPKGQDVQKHFRLRVWMQGTDNNLETGPGVTLAKEPITFLVISPAELRALILLQEDKIRGDLEKVRDKLDKEVRITIADQMEKLKFKDQDLTLVRLRVGNDVIKHLEKTGKVTNTALTEYRKIYDEMYVNRLDQKEINRVSEKIVRPLEDITNLKVGELAKAQDAAGRSYADLEADEELFKAEQGKTLPIPQDVRDKHMLLLAKAQIELDALVKKLNGIIEAIGGEFDRKKAETLLVAIIEDQERQTQDLKVMHKQEEEKLLNILKGISGGK